MDTNKELVLNEVRKLGYVRSEKQSNIRSPPSLLFEILT